MTHKSSAWKVLGLYLASAWMVLQVVDVLAQNVGLPSWTFSVALALLAIGLPIVGTTAYLHGLGQGSPTPTSEEPSAPRKLLSWRNATLGGIGAFTLLGVSVGGYLLMWSTGFGPLGSLVAKGVLDEDDPVILAEFANESSDPQIASVVTRTLRVDLEQSRVLRVLPDAYLSNVLQRMNRDPTEKVSAEVAREAAIREGIKAVIEGEVGALGPGFVLTARIVDPGTGNSYASFRETAETEAGLVSALDRLSRALRERAGESLRSIGDGQPLASVTTASLSALRKYSEALELEERGQLLPSIALLEEALREDSAFAMVYRKLAVIHGNRGETQLRRDYAAKAYEYRHRLTEVERHLASAYYFSAFGDPEQSIKEYEAALRLNPDESSALNNLAVMYRLDGRTEEAVTLLERAAWGIGESNTAYANLVEDQLELGNVPAARRAMERFEIRFPAQYWRFRARSLLGISESDGPVVHEAASAILDDPSVSAGRRRGAIRYMAMVDMRMGLMHEAATHLLEAAELAREAGFGSEALFREIEAGHAFLHVEDRALDPLLDRLTSEAEAPEGPAVAAAVGSLLWKADARDRFEDLVRRSGGWVGDTEELNAARMRLRILEAAASADPAALELLNEAEGRIACSGCLRGLEIDVLEALGRWPEMLEVGEDVLARPLDATWAPANEPLLRLRLARAYEEIGDAAAASTHYERVAELWSDGDPELQPVVRQARDKAAALPGG